GETGEPCGMPRRLSRASVVRIRRPRCAPPAGQRRSPTNTTLTDEGPESTCAVKRRRFSSGCKAHPASLQPEATGAGMEVTKCLKPPDSGHESGDRASVQAATRVNAEQSSHDGRVVKQYVLSFLEASRRRDGRWRNSSLYRALCVGGDLFSYPVLRYETQ